MLEGEEPYSSLINELMEGIPLLAEGREDGTSLEEGASNER